MNPPPHEVAPQAAASGLRLALAAALALACAVVFWPSLSGDLVYDDLLLVERSPATQSIGAAFAHALEPFWAFDQSDSVIQRGLWRPLTSFLLALGRGVDGGEPFGFHVVSLLLHIAATLTAFRFAALLLRTRGSVDGTRAELAAAAAALLFALHPSQVEAVAWISAVNDPAWALFALLGLLAYERAALAGRAPWATPAWLMLALLCKEQAAVAPVLAIALDATARRRPSRAAIALVALPLLVWFAVRAWVFRELGAGLFREHGEFGLSAMREVTFRIELLGGFLQNAVWPSAPAVFRPVHPVLPEGSLAVTTGVVLSLLAAGALVVTWWRRQSAAAFGVATLLVVIAPICVAPDRAGLFPLSDRYLYLGVFGVALAAAGLLARLRSGLPLYAFAVVASVLLGRTTWQHQATFADELAFRDAAVEDAPNSPNVRWGAGRAYVAEYLRTQDTDMLSRAYLHYLHSLKAVTIYGDGSFVDDESKPFAERIARLENLILQTPASELRRDPTVFATFDDRFQATLGQITVNLLSVDVSSNPDLEYPLLLAQSAKELEAWQDRPELDALLAEIHARRGEIQEAKNAIAEALRRAPSNTGYSSQLATLLMRERNWDGARTTLQRAVEVDPDDMGLRLDLANAALEGGRLEIAERELKVVLDAQGSDRVRALVLRAALESRRGRPSEALRWVDEALQIDPNSGPAHKQRGAAMLRLGDADGALEGFGEAARLLVEDFESHYNLAALLLQQHPGDDADEASIRSWETVVQPILLRAYMLAPPTGQEQLLLQRQLEALVREDPDAAFNLATILFQQNRIPLALIWITMATRYGDGWPADERAENLTLAFTLQGQLYRQLGQAEDALAAFQGAVGHGPDHFPAQFDLGDLLFRLNRAVEAEPHLRKALELFPSAGVAPEMRSAVKGMIEQHLAVIEAQTAPGPPAPVR